MSKALILAALAAATGAAAGPPRETHIAPPYRDAPEMSAKPGQAKTAPDDHPAPH